MPLVQQLHLVMMSKYSKFGVDTFNTFWVMSYIKVFAQRQSRSQQLDLFFQNRQAKNMVITVIFFVNEFALKTSQVFSFGASHYDSKEYHYWHAIKYRQTAWMYKLAWLYTGDIIQQVNSSSKHNIIRNKDIPVSTIRNTTL